MKNTFGTSLTVTIAGESHGEAITTIVDGLMPGIEISEKDIADALALRRPAGRISTARYEPDGFRILSGVFEGHSTGTPICISISNENVKSAEYDKTRYLPRPSHADYSAEQKYCGFQDYRGGGHFSGRVTAGLVAAGAICRKALEKKGIIIGSHVSKCGNISDRGFESYEDDIKYLSDKSFPVLSADASEKMQDLILSAKEHGDSVGGVVETCVLGMPSGVGEPWFDSVEGVLSHILFSVPAVKGIEFGRGFELAQMTGSEANDEFAVKNGKTYTKTNNNGGINGGITNGMPLIFRCAVKPTPSIDKEQNTVDMKHGIATKLQINGRHDPCIAHRAAQVINACASIALLDLLETRYGTDLTGL